MLQTGCICGKYFLNGYVIMEYVQEKLSKGFVTERGRFVLEAWNMFAKCLLQKQRDFLFQQGIGLC